MSSNSPQSEFPESQDFILFAQHGWADTHHDIAQLAHSLVKPDANRPIYTPDLGWIDTWLTIALLIDTVEKIAAEAIALYPNLPLRIIGHSMGALIWLEVLDRHREWWHKIHSLILVGSPVGGSDLGRLFDPLRLFPLIARDLGTNRRRVAEAIASQVPTASIVGDIGNNTDGTVPVSCSQFTHATFVRLDGLRHATLKNHPRVAEAVRQFWLNPTIASIQTDTASLLIAKLRSLNLTDINNQNFQYAKVIKIYPDGTKLWMWTNPLQLTHIFVSHSQDRGDRCIYSAYIGLLEKHKLTSTIENI
ncbi:MAG: lysophospholipase [Pseudanabaena frigida]|uniref:Lysophospholipase n=1 Tax=Pseudanabaena frigida TaxID=945775 RepID=A0A2W4XY19_9CYAN|nr:MAG: lysophospholipase [Pseudanabaena frigida]